MLLGGSGAIVNAVENNAAHVSNSIEKMTGVLSDNLKGLTAQYAQSFNNLQESLLTKMNQDI